MTSSRLNRSSEASFKLVLLGDSGAGKSSIALRYTENRYDQFVQTTVSGAAYANKIVERNGEEVILNVWDTAGQERFKGIAPLYYRGSDAALVVYDITNTSSFEKAKEWIRTLQLDASPKVVIALVGNKLDRSVDAGARQVNTATAQQYANQESLLFMEVSALTGQNVEECLNQLVEKLPARSSSNHAAETYNIENKDSPSSSSWFWCAIL
eukprot:m.23164 g.23164  ORF g.23164 m.23164 type:complete len:211 (+) comp5526_c0_seq2:234-866(+)